MIESLDFPAFEKHLLDSALLAARHMGQAEAMIRNLQNAGLEQEADDWEHKRIEWKSYLSEVTSQLLDRVTSLQDEIGTKEQQDFASALQDKIDTEEHQGYVDYIVTPPSAKFNHVRDDLV